MFHFLFLYMSIVPTAKTYTRDYHDASRSTVLGQSSVSRPRRTNIHIFTSDQKPSALLDKFFGTGLTRSGRVSRVLKPTSYLVTELRGNRVQLSIQSSNFTARDVFFSSRVLPYHIDVGEFRVIESRYSGELGLVHRRYSESCPRVPILYRVTDYVYVDDLGRVYVSEPTSRVFKLEWYPYRLSVGSKFRDNITLPGGYNGRVSLSRSFYMFVGCAGYPSYVQEDYMFSLKYDFHHIEENKLDVRPDTIIPIPKAFHKFIHSQDLSESRRSFFKMYRNIN